MSTPTKTERIQLRASPEAKAQILEAASLTQQDTTSFILDAATSRARAVLLERQILKFSADDLDQLEAALDSADTPSPELIKLFEQARQDSRLAE